MCQETAKSEMQIYIASNPCKEAELAQRIVKGSLDFSLQIKFGNVSIYCEIRIHNLSFSTTLVS